jgi:hypothetical protein
MQLLSEKCKNKIELDYLKKGIKPKKPEITIL